MHHFDEDKTMDYKVGFIFLANSMNIIKEGMKECKQYESGLKKMDKLLEIYYYEVPFFDSLSGNYLKVQSIDVKPDVDKSISYYEKEDWEKTGEKLGDFSETIVNSGVDNVLHTLLENCVDKVKYLWDDSTCGQLCPYTKLGITDATFEVSNDCPENCFGHHPNWRKYDHSKKTEDEIDRIRKELGLDTDKFLQ